MGLSILVIASTTHAQDAPPEQSGRPPPEVKPLVEAPKFSGEVPSAEKNAVGVAASLSAGGQLTAGNSRLIALTANGKIETHWSKDTLGASILANYGQGAPPGTAVVETAENVQGRLRYDRSVLDRAALFLVDTVLHDRFLGLDLRDNFDPGLKYVFVKAAPTSLWAEVGYDFQYDVRRDDARVPVDASAHPIAGAPLLDKTHTDHSTRLFVGFHHGFNPEVTLSTGVEYLQSVVDVTRYRANYDTLFAAKVTGHLAIGFGLVARIDHAPLPGKERLDTSTTVSLIYSYSDVVDVSR
jgi:putative salt-induced outer membrane protein YdiY